MRSVKIGKSKQEYIKNDIKSALVKMKQLVACEKREAWDAANKYIAARSASGIEGGPRYTPFAARDEGLVFAGVRQVEGFALALLKCGDETLVLPLDDASAKIATGLQRGTSVAAKMMDNQPKVSRGRRW